MLAVHRKTQHGIEAGVMWQWDTPTPDGEPQKYRMAFLTKGRPREFPVEGCRGRAETRMEMRVHFLHRHLRDTVIVLEYCNTPHTRCPWCDILVLWEALNRRHVTTTHCTKLVERKRCWLTEE